MSKKILIVDDDKSIRESYKFILDGEDISIIEAKDGEEGYKIAKENKLDMIITDYEMPKMNGLRMAEKIKLELNIPIFMISGSDLREGSNLKNIKNIDYYVEKPIDIDKFLNIVHKGLNK